MKFEYDVVLLIGTNSVRSGNVFMCQNNVICVLFVRLC